MYIEKIFIFKYFSCLKSWYVNNSRMFQDCFEVESKSIQFHWIQFFRRVRFWIRFTAIFFARNRVYFWFFISRSIILSFTSSMSKRKKSMLKTVVNRIREIATFAVVIKSQWDKVFIVTLDSREKIFETRGLKNETKKFICRIIVFEKSCDVIMRCVFCNELEIDIWTSSNKFA